MIYNEFGSVQACADDEAKSVSLRPSGRLRTGPGRTTCRVQAESGQFKHIVKYA